MRNCALALIVAAAGVWQAMAQTSAGLNGVVLDSSGALMPGTNVVVTNLDNGSKRETVSNESGLYQFALLQPGRYSISARQAGFKQATKDGIELEVNQVAKIDFTLEPGALNETI